MQDVAVIVMYGVPDTGVVALGCAFTPEGKPLHMALSPELSPQALAQAAAFFEYLTTRETPEALFVPHADGRGAMVSAPLAEDFGFVPMENGCMLAPLSPDADAMAWLQYAFTTARQATLDAAVADMSQDFEGLG